MHFVRFFFFFSSANYRNVWKTRIGAVCNSYGRIEKCKKNKKIKIKPKIELNAFNSSVFVYPAYIYIYNERHGARLHVPISNFTLKWLKRFTPFVISNRFDSVILSLWIENIVSNGNIYIYSMIRFYFYNLFIYFFQPFSVWRHLRNTHTIYWIEFNE